MGGGRGRERLGGGPRSRRLLVAALRAILPGEEETLLLRACFAPAEERRAAWARFERRVGDPARFLREPGRGRKRFLPFLAHALRHDGIPLSREVRTCLRTARLYERRRAEAYGAIVAATLERLEAEETPCLVVKGAAFGPWLYGDSALRHSHDVELIVHRADLARAASALTRNGFARPTGRGTPAASGTAAGGAVVLRHRSLLPIELRRFLFRSLAFRTEDEGFWSRCHRGVVAGRPAGLLAPEDSLVLVCGEAVSSVHRGSLLWVCDAWRLISSFPDLRWGTVHDAAARSRLRPVLEVCLRYLACELGAPVPAPALAELSRAARRPEDAELEAALFAARSACGGWTPLLAALPSWTERAACARRAVFPSRGHLQRVYGTVSGAGRLLLYAYRPVRYVYRRLLRAASRRAGTSGAGGRRGPAPWIDPSSFIPAGREGLPERTSATRGR